MKGVLAALMIIASSTAVLAYIDPGTGSAIAGSIWPFILMILGAIGAFFAKWLFKPIKHACHHILHKIRR